MNAPVNIDVRGRIAWVTIDHPPVNATSTAVRAGLFEAVQRVQDCDLAVLACAGKTFVAGGDMSEFDAPPVPPHLPDVVDAIETSATPFLALMHGTVLGGGFEIAMACAYRVARSGTRFGLPEVNMGLIPGAGGTQRAPRLLGWDMAVDMSCLGKMKTVSDLMAVGALDLVSDAPQPDLDGFVGRAFTPVSQRVVAPMPDVPAQQARVATAAKGRRAPAQNLEALQWAAQPYVTAQPKERARHLELRTCDESRALRHIFFAERQVTRPASLQGIGSRGIAQVALVGGGLMGCGIAASCLMAGRTVTLIERDRSGADTARDRITGLLDGALARGKITSEQHTAQLGALTVSINFADAANADLGIEAVFEDLETKRAVLRQLADVMDASALLATNTSYLNPDDIFAGIAGQQRCLGLHFFSPAHIMKLVEVVRASGTDTQTLASAFGFAKSLRKTPVLAGVCDGFIGNRILSAYRRAAEYLLADGALPHEVDAAMRAFGMAMGPFEAQDQAGLQIAEANRRRQDATRDPRERYVPFGDQLCELGRYGRRSGAGWYTYGDGAKSGARDAQVEALIIKYSAQAGLVRKTFTPADIQNQLLAVMANEGAQIVAEGIAESDAAVDVVKTSGYGFPRWRGGPMHWAQTVGAARIEAALHDVEQASPGSWTRAPRFQRSDV